MQRLSPFLWFDSHAEEATALYTATFPDSEINTVTRYPDSSPVSPGKVMTVECTIGGQRMTALNGGPAFRMSPALSLLVHTASKEEIDAQWAALAEGGMVLMPLQAYPFSPYYGWCQDRFGVSWQLLLGSNPQRIVPCLMFTGANAGKAEEAISFYRSCFAGSSLDMLARYDAGDGDTVGHIKYARFSLDGYQLSAMDSGFAHAFNFTEGLSMVVHCATQDEVDHFWSALSAGGEESQCAWLKDKYGVSWQIVPVDLGRYIGGSDRDGASRAMQAMLGMKKLDIDAIRRAYEGTA